MALSPIELLHERPGRIPFGYRKGDVDQLLDDATHAYEAVWRERADLDDRVHNLEQELAKHRETEEAIREALISAEKAADERRVQAARDADLTVREADTKAREILHGAYAERERIRRQTERLRAEEAEFRARLRSVLGSTLQLLRDHEERLNGATPDGSQDASQATQAG